MILYLDCSNGISGDMLVAALLGVAGATADKAGPLDKVVRPALKAAGIDKRLVSLHGVRRGEIDALAFRVPEGPGFATFDELIMSMYASKLDQAVADGVARLAQRMAAAESEVHGVEVAHLHELSGIDTAVDLISAVALLHHLKPARVVASPVALGNGTVDTAHGVLPVPAPAVAVLVHGLPTAELPDDGVSPRRANHAHGRGPARRVRGWFWTGARREGRGGRLRSRHARCPRPAQRAARAAHRAGAGAGGQHGRATREHGRSRRREQRRAAHGVRRGGRRAPRGRAGGRGAAGPRCRG